MLPKISCLTVTGWRIVLLKQAIRCFVSQTYQNKELIIVSDGTSEYRNAIADYVSSLNRSDIKLILLDKKYKLGELRNISIEAATGPIITQWDDDDLYHPDRLSKQYDCLMSHQAYACLLSDHLSFFMNSQEMYWVNWVPHSNYGMHQVFPGSIMAFKDTRFRYPEEGQYSTQGEDSIFLSQYYEHTKIAKLSNNGYLYVYRYHGTNTFPEEHHQWVARDHVCTRDFVQDNMPDLMNALSKYNLPQPMIFKARNNESLFIYNAN